MPLSWTWGPFRVLILNVRKSVVVIIWGSTTRPS